MTGNNPKYPIIILYHEHSEEIIRSTQYLKIIDKGKQIHRISSKRQQLWDLFYNARDAEPFLLIYEEYQGTRYVADAKAITGDLLKSAMTDMGMKLINTQDEERNRSQALSYAKDVIASGIIKIESYDDIFQYADKNHLYIKGLYRGQDGNEEIQKEYAELFKGTTRAEAEEEGDTETDEP